MTAENLDRTDNLDELAERRRLEQESHDAERGPSISDTFTWTCPCSATVHVVASVEQPHDCPLSEDEKQAIREAAADEVDEAAEQLDETQTQQLDVFQLAELILVGANNRLAESKTPPNLEKQLALGHALATLELARWTRAAYHLNEQMARLAVNDRNRAIAAQQGPAGIVVPNMVPGRG